MRWMTVIAALFLLAGSAHAQVFEDVHKCDEFAAHPNDPHRWAAGVADTEIIPGPAVKFCREAVAEHPQTPRFAFQLGRALWAAYRLDEGLSVFLKLEEDFEYGPVYAYLGDAYMYGIGGAEVDEELAVTLYQIADEAGFTPAGEVLAALAGDDTGSAADEETGPVAAETPPPDSRSGEARPRDPERPFNARDYAQPKIVGALYSGNLDALKAEGIGKSNYAGISNTLIYVTKFHEGFGGEYNWKDPECVHLYKPSLHRTLSNRLLSVLRGSGAGGTLDGAAELGMKAFAEMLTDMSWGGGGMDASRIIQLYGCRSETVKRIYANIEAYARGRPGVLTPEEQERQERAKAEQAAREEQERQAAIRDAAKASCVGQFKKEDYCGCLIEGLDELGIGEADWRKLLIFHPTVHFHRVSPCHRPKSLKTGNSLRGTALTVS